jgi:hypothetical protein
MANIYQLSNVEFEIQRQILHNQWMVIRDNIVQNINNAEDIRDKFRLLIEVLVNNLERLFVNITDIANITNIDNNPCRSGNVHNKLYYEYVSEWRANPEKYNHNCEFSNFLGSILHAIMRGHNKYIVDAELNSGLAFLIVYPTDDILTNFINGFINIMYNDRTFTI